jgi:hypothetical protein
MAVVDVSRIRPENIRGYQVSAANLGDINVMLAEGFAAGRFTYEVKPHMCDDGTPGSLVVFRFPDGAPDLFAYPGYWIFEDDEGEIEVYDGPDAQARRTADVPLDWADVTPVVDVEAATVTVRQPDSLNGPFDYSVKLDGNSAPVEGSEVTKVCDSSDMTIGSDIVLQLGGPLGVGDHTVEVACAATRYKRSAVSRTVTCTVEPEPEPEPETQEPASD